MKVVCLISWYDEKPDWLAGTIAALAGNIDHVVAVDGAYALYPKGKARSPSGQADAIREACSALKLGCTIHEPPHPWAGNEVEKRNFMFHLAEKVTDEDDWYIVMDGDEVVTDIGYNLRRQCEESVYDCAEVTMWSHREHVEPHERPFVTARVEEFPIRIMFKAIRGLSVVEKHYIYKCPDGRLLWGDGRENLEPADNFQHLRVYHRKHSRDPWRAKEAREYYEMRDRLNIEHLFPDRKVKA